MRRDRRMGKQGLVSIVHNATTGAYDCYWYCGPHDARLVDQVAMPSSSEAIGWGGDRSTRIRIRAGGSTRWAGSAPPPTNVPQRWDPDGESPSESVRPGVLG